MPALPVALLVSVNSVNLYTCRNCHFRTSDKNSDIAIRVSDPDFLKDSNNLAIRRRLQVFFSLCRLKICHISLWLWPRTCVTGCTPRWDDLTKFVSLKSVNLSVPDYVLLLSLWPLTLNVYRLWRNQALYQILAKSNNLRLSYSGLKSIAELLLAM